MHLRPFELEDFAELQRWFHDPILNQWLGPMDLEWLEAVLEETPIAQYIAVRGTQSVACIGFDFPDSENQEFAITDLAVRPDRRRQGIGRITIELLVEHFSDHNVRDWVSYVESNNVDAKKFLESIGWRVDRVKHSAGMIRYSRPTKSN